MWLALLLIALAGLVAGLGIARMARQARAARSRREGREGMETAFRLLRRAGYRVTGTEVTGRGVVVVDGAPREYLVRADALARRRFRRYVVEVKGAPEAASLDNRETRRQLLEYALVFRTRGILLVDAPAAKIHRVEFPSLG